MLKVTLVKSPISSLRDQQDTVKALGLHKVNQTVVKPDNACIRVLRAPGLALQGLTTREPDDSMLECALAAFVAVLTPEQRAAQVPEDYRLPTEIEEEAENAPDSEQNIEGNENPEGIVTEGIVTEKPMANEPVEEPEETEAVEAVEAPLLPDDNDGNFPDKR